MTRYPRLTIVHNHGTLRLADVTVGSDGVARGTVLAGHVTNRLFHASSTRPVPRGSEACWPLYGRVPHSAYCGGVVAGAWVDTPVPGEYAVDCTFC